MSLVTIYATVRDSTEADRVSEALVRERLVACVNALPGVRSTYRWDGEICRDEEVALLAKTTSDLFEAVAERIRSLHSYDTPCVVAWPIEACDERYATWVREQIADPAPRPNTPE